MKQWAIFTGSAHVVVEQKQVHPICHCNPTHPPIARSERVKQKSQATADCLWKVKCERKRAQTTNRTLRKRVMHP
jgi:hypothetical protein